MNTSEATLSSLKGYALPPLILEFRGITKKISTYLEPMKDYVMPKDNRIHTNFNPFDTSTGRLSSDSPNLQNLPNKTGKEIRKMFTAPEGQWIVSSDYGQIEARIIGVASQDEAFCDALWNDYDVHMKWAEIIANEYPKVIGGSQFLSDKKAMKSFRAKVKNLWVFPAFYGASPFSIAKGIGVPIEIVQDVFSEFWKTFKGVKRWQKWLLNRYDQLGYVETLTGRRRRAPLSMNAILNSAIQGTASDICVDAMCRLDKLGYDVIMNIHDDVTCYIPDDTLEESIQEIAQEMCAVPFKWINVPISIEISAGLNWYEQEEVGTFKSTEYHDVPRKIVDFTKMYDFK
jgi:DNA polymerase-1